MAVAVLADNLKLRKQSDGLASRDTWKFWEKIRLFPVPGSDHV